MNDRVTDEQVTPANAAEPNGSVMPQENPDKVPVRITESEDGLAPESGPETSFSEFKADPWFRGSIVFSNIAHYSGTFPASLSGKTDCSDA
jgi:hypothetical protein